MTMRDFAKKMRPLFLFVIMLILGAASCDQKSRTRAPVEGTTADPSAGVAYAAVIEKGPYETSELEFRDLVDKSRNKRSVPLKVHFPTSGSNFPLVILSHGASATWDSNLYQARFLASHGYVVICPRHVFSDKKQLDYLRSPAGGKLRYMKAVHFITTDARAVLERPGDISFAIDQATRWNKEHRNLKGKINTSKIAIMGHSFGAYTTLAVCGARPILDYLHDLPSGKEKGLAGDLSDSRVTFGLAMSPQSPGSTFFGKDSYKTINKPLFFLSGSKDGQQSARGGKLPADSRKEAFRLSPPGQKYLVWLANADHLSFSENPASKRSRNRSHAVIQRITRAMMLNSCNYFLKGEKSAAEGFNQRYLERMLEGPVKWVEFEEK